jgi:hypothetical protein
VERVPQATRAIVDIPVITATTAAIMLVALAVLELISGPTLLVKGVAIAFVASRALHAAAVSTPGGSQAQGDAAKPWLRMRIAGALGTALCGFAATAGLVAAVLAAAPVGTSSAFGL